MGRMIFILAIFGSVLQAAPPSAPIATTTRNEASPVQAKVDVVQQHGKALPLDTTVTDEMGVSGPIGRFFGTRPALMAFVYYECPSICGMIMTGTFRVLKMMDLKAGKDFDLLFVSIDPREDAKLAKAKKENFLRRYNLQDSAKGIHFLTAPRESIATLTNALGFKYQYDEKTDQYAHPALLTALTPEGTVSQYHAGVEYKKKAVRLSLVEASGSKVGNVLDQFFLYCYRYDPTTGQYGLVIMNVLRVLGVVTVGMIAILVMLFLRLEKARRESGVTV